MKRTVLVTGSNGGIGSACVDAFAGQGDSVVPLDRQTGVELCDSSSIEKHLAHVARVDVLIHAAGSVGQGGLEDTTMDDWVRVIDDNLTSAFVTAQVVVPRMVHGSSIVLLSSVNARTGGSRLSGPAYASSKAALLGFMRFLASDLSPRGIRVNAVAPGPVITQMLMRLPAHELDVLLRTTPLERFTHPHEIAESILYLTSSAASSITGSVIDINGGRWFS